MAVPSTVSTDFDVQSLQIDLQTNFAKQVQQRLTKAETSKNDVSEPQPAATSSSLIVRSAAQKLTQVGANSENLINGTFRNDDITGTLNNDRIRGLNGNDKMRGDNGNDVLIGGNGNDVMSGDHVPGRTTQSDDILYGQNGNDQLFGRIGNDRLFGNNGNDQLFGGSGSDKLFGGSGNDQLFGGVVSGDASFNKGAEGGNILFGGAGNDFVQGGSQRDSVVGTDRIAKGLGEFDVLKGGGGSDFFFLGDRNNPYYTKGGSNQDFGLIADFETNDRIVLNGSASQYVVGYNSDDNSTFIGRIATGSFELVGSIAGLNNPGLNSSNNIFRYV